MKTISGGTRESAHDRTSAYGAWPATSSARRAASMRRSAVTSLTKRSLPSFSRASAAAGVGAGALPSDAMAATGCNRAPTATRPSVILRIASICSVVRLRSHARPLRSQSAAKAGA